jgi:Fe-S oxidoreductase
LKLSKINKKITYHDPCYLGRHNFIWEEPREILKNISKEEIVEMDYNKKKSICCGGGGGCLWMERGNGVIMEQVRLKQAMELKVDVIASACPFCIQQLESAREELNAKIEVKDIIELVYEAVCSS